MSVTPRILFSITSFIDETNITAKYDTMTKVVSIGMSLFQQMCRLILTATKSDCIRANIPDRAVASPYDGISCGSMVIMNIPKPNPLTLCTKLAPMQNRTSIRIVVVVIFLSRKALLLPRIVFLLIVGCKVTYFVGFGCRKNMKIFSFC